MGGRKIWLALLLMQTFYIIKALVKTIGSKPDLTPICTNETLTIITLVLCKIRTERSREECRLVYRYGHDFEHECDSRFTLMMKNQTVFLHLTRLKPEDSGNYTCECTRLDGTVFLHLNITVEGDEDASSSAEIPLLDVVVGVFIFILITGAIFGVILRNTHHGRRPEAPTSRPNTEQHIEPYSTFIQRENELYSLSSYTVTPVIQAR